MKNRQLDKENTTQEDEEMSNRIPVQKKEKIITAYEGILDMIYYVGNGMMTTKQLIVLLSKTSYGSSINNQKAISEMIKNDILIKKQILASKCHILIMTSPAISHYTGEPTRDVSAIATSDKSILNNIQSVEIILGNIDDIIRYYEKQEISGIEIKSYFEELCCSYTILPKNILEYYGMLDENLPKNLWGTSFYDDLAVLRVEKANKKNTLCKYERIEISPEDLKIKQDLDWLKDSMTPAKQSQEFFNFHNLLNSSIAVNYINMETDTHMDAQIVLYDNGNLSPERIAELTSYCYLMLKRYIQSYQTKIYLKVYINCLNEDTLNVLKVNCEKRAEDNFGYRQCTKLVSLMYNSGCRFPDSTDNISFIYLDSGITKKYGIESK